MPTASSTRRYDFPADHVWTVLDDFGAISTFHPLVSHSETTNGQATGLGAERSCVFDKGPTFERISGYDPGRQMEIEISETGPFPLNRAVATLSVEPLGAASCQFIFEIDFTPKCGVVGKMMGPMMAKQFSGILEKVQAELDAKLRSEASGDVASTSAPLAAAA